METDFSDIVSIMEQRRANIAPTITIAELCAGPLPTSMTAQGRADRDKEFNEALTRWYADTEPQVSNM